MIPSNSFFTPKYLLYGLASVFLVSCASYDNVDNQRSLSSQNQVAQQSDAANGDSSSNYYEQYFGEQAERYGNFDAAMQEIEGDSLFTDVESYSSNSFDPTNQDNTAAYGGGSAAWGEQPSNVNINIIDNGWGWGPGPLGWNTGWGWTPQWGAGIAWGDRFGWRLGWGPGWGSGLGWYRGFGWAGFGWNDGLPWGPGWFYSISTGRFFQPGIGFGYNPFFHPYQPGIASNNAFGRYALNNNRLGISGLNGINRGRATYNTRGSRINSNRGTNARNRSSLGRRTTRATRSNSRSTISRGSRATRSSRGTSSRSTRATPTRSSRSSGTYRSSRSSSRSSGTMRSGGSSRGRSSSTRSSSRGGRGR